MSASPSEPFPRPLRPHRRRFASLRTIFALILREMATTHGRSPGGYLWAVLEPVAGIALLTLVFSVAFRNPALGINFPIFYATGMMPFLLFSDLSNKVSQSLNFSRALLVYPSVTFVDAIAGRFLTNLLTQLLVNYIVFAGILVLYETRTVLDLPTLALALGLTAYLGLGIGTLNCYLLSRFMVWQQIWSIVMRPMFILSCVFFMFDSVPQPYRDYLWYNPLIHLVGLTRRAFYPIYDAPYVSVLYVALVASVCLALGLLLLRAQFRDLLNN